ncbi:MAG: hypothetical protein V2A62_05160 [Candidatus Woesearchaeota archaeon]
MQKRGQLGIIEFKYFIIGLIIGIVIGIVLIYLSLKGIIPISLKSSFCGIVGK